MDHSVYLAPIHQLSYDILSFVLIKNVCFNIMISVQ